LALPGIDCTPRVNQLRGLAHAVALVNVVEDEAGAPNQGDGVTGEMTAIGYTVLERFQSALPCRHARIRSKAMFEEVNRPPGRSTRRTSARAVLMSGIVHRAKVQRASSQESPGSGIDWPSSPTSSTGTGERSIRRCAIRKALADGSTAKTLSTVGG